MKYLSKVCAAVALACLSAEALGGPPDYNPEASRNIAGGRAVEVLVAQSEIKTDIMASDYAAVGGILGGLMAASQEAARTKKAEAAIAPLRNALTGFDADALALEASKTALAATGWLQPASLTISKDSSLLGKSAFLDKAGTEQTLFIEYTYDATADFSALRVTAALTLASKAMPADATKPEARLTNHNLAYAGAIVSLVGLPNAEPKNIQANAARWAADGAKPARTALTLAFAAIQTLLPRALSLSQADIKAMGAKDKPKRSLFGYYGRLQEDDGGSLLIWSQFPQLALLRVQPLP